MSANMPLILVIEDEAPIRKFLRVSLTAHGYHLVEAETAEQGLRLAAQQPPDLVILDLGLPDQDGLELLARLREWFRGPILILSARGNEQDKVKALDQGADDYLTKPFGVEELQARLRVALRHSALARQPTASPIFETGELKVDLGSRRVFRAGEEIHLTPLEYRLLTTMIQHAGKVLTHRFLLKEVWGPQQVQEHHYLRVYMAGLRRKIEKDSALPQYLLTETGVGYRLRQVDTTFAENGASAPRE
ncbi:MAG: response regulator [Pirellulales bacterium]|nr:response regulator [Pirellulales bacterium]